MSNLKSLKVEENEEIIVYVVNCLGIENMVTFAAVSLTCTCSEHNEKIICAHIIFVLDCIKLKDIRITAFTASDFELVKQHSNKLLVTDESPVLEIVRIKRNVPCIACNSKIKKGSLSSWVGGSNYCVNKLCIPSSLKKYTVSVVAKLTDKERSLIKEKGFKLV